MKIIDNQIYVLEYLNPLFFFSIVFILANVFCETLQSEGDSKTPVIIFILSNVLNLILDSIFIYVFKMNIRGVAYASIIFSLFGVLIFFIFILQWKNKGSFKFEIF